MSDYVGRCEIQISPPPDAEQCPHPMAVLIEDDRWVCLKHYLEYLIDNLALVARLRPKPLYAKRRPRV